MHCLAVGSLGVPDEYEKPSFTEDRNPIDNKNNNSINHALRASVDTLAANRVSFPNNLGARSSLNGKPIKTSSALLLVQGHLQVFCFADSEEIIDFLARRRRQKTVIAQALEVSFTLGPEMQQCAVSTIVQAFART